MDDAGQLVSCSMDDTVRYTNLTLRDYRCVRGGWGGTGDASAASTRNGFSLLWSLPSLSPHCPHRALSQELN